MSNFKLLLDLSIAASRSEGDIPEGRFQNGTTAHFKMTENEEVLYK